MGGVLFLIRSLHRGGAERQLITLAIGLHQRGRRVVVATFYPDGELAAELAVAGVPLRSLDKRGRWDLIGASRRLLEIVRRERPAVLHSYLPDPNILTGLLRPWLRGIRVVWGVRASHMDPQYYDWTSRAAYAAAAMLSRLADVVIVNSSAGELHHRERGYAREKLHVVPNGIDTARFARTETGRRQIRAEWGIAENAPLIGLVARLDPMKDHGTFLLAARQVMKMIPHARFVCVGDGPAEYAAQLAEQAATLGIGASLVWAGGRDDMPAVYSALDIATSTSLGEGFPNVIAEAMSCGTPCVVTDVGDSALIVGAFGMVVPARDPTGTAAAWQAMLVGHAPDRSAIRGYIERMFGVERLLTETEQLLWGDL